jgi:2'-5' RNA ligase
MPAFSVCLLLDERADRAVRHLWERLERDGVSTLATHTHGRHVPHLTLAALGVADLEQVRRALDGLARSAPLDVRFQALGVFTRSRCWLLPTATVELLDRQRSVAQALDAFAVHRHYRPGSWQPHVTVAPRLPVDTLPRVASRVYEVVPLPARLARMVAVDTSTGAVHDLSPSGAPA